MTGKVYHVSFNLIFDVKTVQMLTIGIIAFLILSVQLAFTADLTEDFKLKRAGLHCEPEMNKWIAVPGRNMKAGSFITFYDKASGGKEESRISGVLVKNEAIYYPSTDGNFWTDEMNFGFYGNYLVMDAWPIGAHHGRRMFLYRLGDNNVELLDAVGRSYSTFDFMSVSKSDVRSGEYSVGLVDVADIDHDNNPELKLKIYWDYIFTLYLEIKDNRLKIDLNPEPYRPLFARERRIRPNKKTSAYYIYGFLSGELNLEEIKETISRDKRHKERYGEIVKLLEKADRWDEALHEDGKPVLLRYDLKEAMCNE